MTPPKHTIHAYFLRKIDNESWVEIPPKLTTSFRGKVTTESYFAN
jgi:hypothetical protein